MRIYYIFNIKDEIAKLYKKNPKDLFKILENIYYMQEEDANYGFNIFNQLTNIIKVDELNNELFIKLHKDMVYSKIKNEHIINNLYQDEVSILKVKKAYLLLESNKSYSSFFKILYEDNSNYFICDFKEKDFFFIDDIKTFLRV